jgi:hypothetical protein
VAETTWLDERCSVIEGEAVALFEALKALQLRGMSHVMLKPIQKIW